MKGDFLPTAPNGDRRGCDLVDRLTGLAPRIGTSCTLLILGSFPSAQSLAKQQYYANPHNHFWKIMADLFGIPRDMAYEDAIAALNRLGVALWDVIESCEREGSGDASIQQENPNDFISLFKDYPHIRWILFNGTKAEQTWRKWFGNLSQEDIPALAGMHFYRMPSTSPRNPHKKEKLLAWRRIVQLSPVDWSGSDPTNREFS